MSKKTISRASAKPAAPKHDDTLCHKFLTLRTLIGSSISSYLGRRPHRSFQRTRRRDYVRSLDLPGYWSFTGYVLKIISSHRRLFVLLVITYVLLGAAFVGLSPQGSYTQLSELLDQSGNEIFSGGWGTVGQAGLLLVSSASGSLNAQYTEAQQIFSGIIFLLTWLTTVWLLRGILAGHRPKLRDGFYNSGGPIVATAIVLLIALLQLLPAILAVIVFRSAVTTELFDSGFMAMIISLAVGAVIVLSLYWVVSTLMALVVVTLPGMYPWQAIRTAGDLVVGRRLRILLRLAWMMGGNVIIWVVIVLPVIIIDRAVAAHIPAIQSVPVVPFVMALVSSTVVVWSAAYMYLLYRKVVEDDAKPA